MRIALIGAPGSGKGTQAQLLAQRYRVPHITTGELLRQATQSDKNFPKEARQDIEAGRLVDDELVRSLLEERLRQRDTKRGFVIDGYPRNIPQAQSLDNLLGMLGRGLQIAVYNQVEDDVLVKRNTGRLTCAKCGTIFNTFYSPPAQKGVCDNCGSKKLEARKEDARETLATRVESYKEFITPLITYYRAQHKLRTVSAMGTVEDIHEKICDIVDLEIRPLEIDAMVTAGHIRSEEESTVIAGGQINRLEPSNEPEPEKKPASKASQMAQDSGSKAKPAPAENKARAAGKTGKKVTKKVAAKKTTAKKSTSKKTAASKVTANKAAAKKTTSKKVTAKKATVKKVAKKVAKKTASKKTAVKKPTVQKVAKKKVAKKVTAKKKAVTKKTGRKKVAKKAAAKKSAAKKKTAKKSTARKKTTRKTGKSATRKQTTKKTAARKTAGKKKAAKKKAGKKKA